MLTTLTKIGEQLLEGKGIWARLTTEPKYNPDKKNWVCPILFDCVNKEIRVLKDEMELFEPEESIIKYKYLSPSLWGPRGKKCSLTIEPSKFTMLEETLFGKKSGDVGSLLRSMDEFPSLNQTPIYSILEEINETLSHKKSELDLESITKKLDLSNQDEVVLFYSLVLTNQIEGSDRQICTYIKGFDEFALMKFASNSETAGLDQVTGLPTNKAAIADFDGRFNINKIFQITSSNYASGFKNFKSSFQIGSDTIAALDKASKYILRNQDRVRIAGVKHIMVPRFLHKDIDQFDIEETNLFLEKSKDLMFQYRSVENEFDKTLPVVDIFWVNYIAYETDLKKTYFKIINEVNDVNCYHVKAVIDAFFDSHNKFYNFIGGKSYFNLESVYRVIPVKEEKKSKKNPVLHLFKDILEQNEIPKNSLYKNFVQFIICHRSGQFDNSGRHRSFKNIRKKSSKNGNKTQEYYYAVHEAVFKFLALFEALQNLNLIDMKTTTEKVIELNKLYPNDDVSEFLSLKKSNRNQIALFCLGRTLSVVGYAQECKNHITRPILNKVNYNGMELNNLKDLSRALLEKGKQYQIVTTNKGKKYHARKRIEEWIDLFSKYLDDSDWEISKEDAVFHLMAGYVFRPSITSNADNSETTA